MPTVEVDVQAFDQLAEHVRYRIGSRGRTTGTVRCHALTRLVVIHWPHRHIEQAMADGGRSCKAIDHAMALVRAQVREQWEARHGVGPVWELLLAGTVAAISHVILDLWCSDPAWAIRLEEIGQQLREAR